MTPQGRAAYLTPSVFQHRGSFFVYSTAEESSVVHFKWLFPFWCAPRQEDNEINQKNISSRFQIKVML
ncbi:hypothetical protein, partial [Faecalibacterium prausnitzii]|uniref:hypothetical protein n=1 Tax=Faecalibacterium prausnitzii TaxID=853 RepID=UPI001A9AE3D8